MLLPDTAETEWLDRHGHIWITNSDSTTGRKRATLAQGTFLVNGTIPWTLVPTATQFLGPGNIGYETLEEVFISTSGNPVPVRVRALDPGAAGNLRPDQSVSMVTTLPGVDGFARVQYLYGGTDTENDDHLRYRVLLRIREPPQGGAKIDYEEWALAVPGCTRAWCAPLEMGIGTVTLRFMMDDLRADRQGFPIDEDIVAVRQYLDQVRPVAVKDLFVVAPIPQRVNMTIRLLDPDNPAVRAAIETSLAEMLRERAMPGQTIWAAWKTNAIMSAAGVNSFATDNIDDVMLSPGHMAVIGDLVFGESLH
jgi:uncharacterized phage protein gp47/JayE